MVRLGDIEQVDWSSLTCACGNARHIPEALSGLCASDLESAEHAYWQLENHVVAHGELFTAAAVIPDIIVGLWPQAHFKALLAHLLYQIGSAAIGYVDPLSVRCLDRTLCAYRTIFSRESLDPAWSDAMQADYQELTEASG
jgi:hypothetical protein